MFVASRLVYLRFPLPTDPVAPAGWMMVALVPSCLSFLWLTREYHRREKQEFRDAPREMALGIVIGMAVELAIECLARGSIDTPTTPQRLLLFGTIALVSLPIFILIGLTMMRVDLCTRAMGLTAPSYWMISIIIGIAGFLWFARMSVVPVYLLATSMLLAGAVQCGGRGDRPWYATGLALVVFSRLLSMVSAFY
jgi:hypothetical protein